MLIHIVQWLPIVASQENNAKNKLKSLGNKNPKVKVAKKRTQHAIWIHCKEHLKGA